MPVTAAGQWPPTRGSKALPYTLYNRTAERINEIALRGEIEIEHEDGTQRLGRMAVVTSDIAEVLDGADVTMVVLPASGHRDIACGCAPHLRDGQIVILNPGRTGGALEFHQILNQEGASIYEDLIFTTTTMYQGIEICRGS